MNVKKFNRIVKSPIRWSNLYFEVMNTLRNPDYRTKDFIKNILNFNGKIKLDPTEECSINCEDMLKSIAINFAIEYKFLDLLPDIKKIAEDPKSSQSLKDIANQK